MRSLLAVTACVAALSGDASTEHTLRILFIGNSLTYGNDLPRMIEAVAAQAGVKDRIACHSVAFPDFGLEEHWKDGRALKALARGGWTTVVLQQGPSSLAESQAVLRDYTRRFAAEARKHGARVVLFGVWPPKSRAHVFDAVTAAYTHAAADVGGDVVAVGAAWQRAWRDDPTLPFYGPDNFHPSPAGSYIAALMFVERFTGRSIVGLPAPEQSGSDVLRNVRLTRRQLDVVQRAASQKPQQAQQIFNFDADGFWLNLHHFLYVLGRAETGVPDTKREAVAGAPDEQARGLATLTPEERASWQEAVKFYAAGPSTKDLVFDQGSIAVTHALLKSEGAAVPAEGRLAPYAPHLNRVAPIYRKTWWPAHKASNEKWMKETTALVDRHGAAVLHYIERAYGMTWKAGGYPVHLSGYANWAGAYSTAGDLLVIGTMDDGYHGLLGMEGAFHEAMHQWDDQMMKALRDLAAKEGIARVPQWLDHAILFYTAGAAVASVAPNYTTLGETAGIWNRSGKPYKPILDEVWMPYLQGKGTRDEALTLLLQRTRDIR